MLHKVWNPVAVRDHYSPLRRHGFKYDVGQTFAEAAENKHINRAIQLARIRQESAESHTVQYSKFFNLPLQPISQLPFSGNHKANRVA